jgi:hypothetical protein
MRLDLESTPTPAPEAAAEAGPEAPEILERIRQSGIRIDREGQFIHEGEPVRHQGLRRALFRWLDRDAERPGRYVLRLDEQRFAYVDVDDTPLVVRALRTAGDTVRLQLSDGGEESLDPTTLTIDGDGILRCQARGGRLEARLATSAAAALAEHLVETPDGPALRVGGRAVPIGRRAPPG